MNVWNYEFTQTQTGKNKNTNPKLATSVVNLIIQNLAPSMNGRPNFDAKKQNLISLNFNGDFIRFQVVTLEETILSLTITLFLKYFIS